jgi:hypothetical protein
VNRQCNMCHEIKDLYSGFFRDSTRKYGRAAICKTCTPIKRKRYAASRSRSKASLKARKTALNLLGNACVCCGDTYEPYLQIDHVDGDGKDHRKELRHGTQALYRWVIQNPATDRVQILCANCHLYKTKYKTLCREHHFGESLVTTPVLPIS